MSGSIIGLGGVFFKSKDPSALRQWYKEILEIPMEEWGTMMPISAYHAHFPDAYTVLSPFKADSDYFKPSDKEFMINFIVSDLDDFIQKIIAKGVPLEGNPVDDDYGKFAWLLDPEMNKIELWEPK